MTITRRRLGRNRCSALKKLRSFAHMPCHTVEKQHISFMNSLGVKKGDLDLIYNKNLGIVFLFIYLSLGKKSHTKWKQSVHPKTLNYLAP